MARKRNPTRLVGLIFPRTDQPDKQGHVVDVDGVTYCDTLPLTADFGRIIGTVQLTRTEQGIVGHATLTERNPQNPKWRGYAFAGGIRVEGQQDARIDRSVLTAVALVPEGDAITPGTSVRVDHRKETP